MLDTEERCQHCEGAKQEEMYTNGSETLSLLCAVFHDSLLRSLN